MVDWLGVGGCRVRVLWRYFGWDLLMVFFFGGKGVLFLKNEGLWIVKMVWMRIYLDEERLGNV